MDDPKKELLANIPPFGLRMQADLKDRLKQAADRNNRSLNAEIVARLTEYDVLSDKYAFAEVEIGSLKARGNELSVRRRELAEANQELQKLREEIAFLKGMNSTLEQVIKTFIMRTAHTVDGGADIVRELFNELRNAAGPTKEREE